jgi:hypothetical protein
MLRSGVRFEGTYPQWSANGRAIFCISNRDLIVVSVAPGDPPRFGSPAKLFTAPVSVAGLGSYAVSSDGQRFVVIDRFSANAGGLPPLTVVLELDRCLTEVSQSRWQSTLRTQQPPAEALSIYGRRS